MKDYIMFIVRNNDSYRRTVSFLMMGLVVLLFILISIFVRKKPLYKVEGIVDTIEKNELLRKNSSTFDVKQQYHLEEVIKIQINGVAYFVETNFQSKWNDVLYNINVGDLVLINYKITDEGNSICQLEKKSFIVLDYKDLLKIEFYIKFGLVVLSFTTFSYILLLFFLRKKYGRVSH